MMFCLGRRHGGSLNFKSGVVENLHIGTTSKWRLAIRWPWSLIRLGAIKLKFKLQALKLHRMQC